MDNKSAAAWTGRGLAQEGLGDRQKARESFARATQLNPTYQPAKDGLARTGVQSAG
jgi:Tfp pilus assembly protein PilF